MRATDSNYVDEQYLSILRDILDNGCLKNTRSGEVLSVFGRSMRFNLKYGFPVLTTKKMYTKGFIHELLWFLKGDTNIKYLIDNGVNFWTPDAYRFYNELLARHEKETGREYKGLHMNVEEFLANVRVQREITLARRMNEHGNLVKNFYTFGDLGPVYGKQWRSWGNTGFDQVKMVVDTLRKNPNDRRLLITGYNPEIMKDVALPPCHTIYQFYARPLRYEERVAWCQDNVHDEWLAPSEDTMDREGCPKYGLSLWFYCRSQDMPLGNPANIMSASLLVSMVAQCVGMLPDEVIWNGGDCHIYTNQIEGVEEQLKRDAHKYRLPELVLNKEIREINDFTFDDIRIEGYESYPVIKFPLSVG